MKSEPGSPGSAAFEDESRSGLIALLHRLLMEHRRPKAMARKLGPAKQSAFIAAFEALLDRQPAMKRRSSPMPCTDARGAAGWCWAPKDISLPCRRPVAVSG